MNSMEGGEGLKGVVVEFTPVVALNRLKREGKLCGDISTKVRQLRKSFGFLRRGYVQR